MRVKLIFFAVIIILSSNIFSQNNVFTNFTDGNQVMCIKAVDNFVWAGTTGGAVRWNLSDGSYKKYLCSDGLAHNWVRSIDVDKDGNIWFGTQEGASKFDGNNWTTYTDDDGMGYGNIVYDIAVDHNGNVWVGTYGGVSRFDGYNWTTYSTDDRLPGNVIWSIAVDNDNNVWISSYPYIPGESSGICKFLKRSSSLR